MTMQDEESTRINREMISIMKELDNMEVVWSDQQRQKQKDRLLNNLAKKKTNEFVDAVLKNCKKHNGLVTSVDELKELVQMNGPKLKSFLCLEIQYQRETHRRDAEVRCNLYKVNSLSVQEMIENLTVLLSTY